MASLKTHFKSYITIVLLLPLQLSAADKLNSLKLNGRLGMGSFNSSSNEAGASGSVSSNGAPEFSLNYYLKPKWSAYLGADFFPSKQEGGLYFWGLKIGSRVYFWNEGVALIQEAYGVKTKSFKRWAAYGLGEIKQYTYYLGSNPLMTQNEIEGKGTFFNYNLGLGLEYKLDIEWELNLEIVNPVLSQASTDNRVNFAGRIIYLGFGYQF